MTEWRYLRGYADMKYFGTASTGFFINSSAQDAVKLVKIKIAKDMLDWWRIVENTSLRSVDSFKAKTTVKVLPNFPAEKILF